MLVEVAVCLPREAHTVGLVRATVTSALRLLGVNEHCVDDIRLALSEACTNVVQHARSVDEYEVRIEIEAQRCVISIVHGGADFDAAALPAPMPGPDATRGRGLAIMRAVMDSVEIDTESAPGLLLRIVKTLSLDPDSPLRQLS